MMPSAATRNFVDMLQQVSKVLKDAIGACAPQLIFPAASGQKANSQGPRAFSRVASDNQVFLDALNKYFGGKLHGLTLERL
jgi:uncharacterized protein (DUF1810 family)